MPALIFTAIMLVLMWLLIINPQQKRVKQHNAVVASLEVGLDVMTTSGLYGRIVSVSDDVVSLEIAPNLTVRIDRRAVGSIENPTPSGTNDQVADVETDPPSEQGNAA